ncbi:MAG: Hsp20/alpha crystallin family protein [Archaeoglobi archaeon]|nr:Hsp20/alpha crystallin family protein [Archaeoglobi archaeon]
MRIFDPFEELRRMQERMARLLDEFDRMSLTAGVELDMPVDVIEEEDRIRIVADLPGFDKSDINVYIEDGDLIIRAERKEEKEDRSRNYIRRERRYGEVYRRISLPAEVDEDKIKARYNNGVLEIEIPKTSKERKVIKIE